MKKKIIFTGIGLLIFIFFLIRSFNSVNEQNQKYEEHEKENRLKKDSVYNQNNPYVVTDLDREELKNLRDKVEVFYNELINFKDNKDFHRYGFGSKYKYNDWLINIEKLSEDEMRLKFNIEYGFSIDDLRVLGNEYLRSKGIETEFSKLTRKRIEKGLKK